MNDWVDLALLAVAVVAIALVVALRLRARSEDESAGDDTQRFRIDGAYRRLVRQAGYDPRLFLPLFWLFKLALAVLLPLGLLEIADARNAHLGDAFLAAAAIAGFFVPDLWLLAVRRERQRKIAWSLSYLLDLIVAFLRAGLPLDEAFRRAGRDGFHPDHPLAREVGLVSREIDLGKDRAAAFRALAERTGLPAMRGVALALESGSRLGASVEATLRGQAELLRNRRREDVLKRIQLASIKALFPVMLCGFPVFLVIVLFPSLIELWNTFVELGMIGR
jgi:tight adherence protein C